MQGLLISKIDEIKVVQVEETKVSFEHKKASNKKPAKKDDNPFKTGSGGSNTTVDLGAGERKITVKFHTFNANDAKQLFNTLYKKRFCIITDKFNGKIKVYIDGVEQIDSDKHIGKTIFSINATIQDDIKKPTINAQSQLKNALGEIEAEIENEAYKFADEVPTADKIIDEIDNTENFFDAGLDKMQKELDGILNLANAPTDYFTAIQQRANKIKSLQSTLERIKTLPNDFVKTMLDFVGIITPRNVKQYQTEASNGKAYTSSSDFSDLSQTEAKEIKSQISADNLLNLIILAQEITQILSKKYKNKDEFDNQLNSALNRFDLTSLSSEKTAEYKSILKAYSNTVSLKKIIDYEVKEETPLTAIVYGLYGNLDYYNDIRDLNNTANNDAVKGMIRVYDASAS